MISFAHSSPGRVQPVSPFRRVEREALCAVFEDCVDQLAVIGGIVPNYAEKPSAVDSVSTDRLPMTNLVES